MLIPTLIKTSWCVPIMVEVTWVNNSPIKLVDSDVVVKQPLTVEGVDKLSSYRNYFFKVAATSNQQFLHNTSVFVHHHTDITHILWIKLNKPFAQLSNLLKMNAKLSLHRFWPAHQDDSNDTPQPICEFQADLPLLWIKDYPGLS